MSDRPQHIANSLDLPHGLTGTERMRRLVRLERINREMYDVALAAWPNVQRDVPDWLRQWVYHLRAREQYIGGGYLRFLGLLALRDEMPRSLARTLATRILDLQRQAMDLMLPEPPDPAPAAMVHRIELVRSTPAHGASLITPSRRRAA